MDAQTAEIYEKKLIVSLEKCGWRLNYEKKASVEKN